MARETAETFSIHDIPIRRFPDRSARWLLSDTENVRALLELVAGDVVEYLDFSRMEQINTSFIDNDFGEREADIALRIPFRDGAETDDLIIYILIEHQSTVDPTMAFRVLSYMVKIWDSQRREWASDQRPKSEWRFSPILPIVYYTGEQRWETPLTLDAVMHLPDVLRRFVPVFDILFLGVKETDAETLTKGGHLFGWLLTVLQKEHASAEEMKSALIEAMSHINALDDAQRHEWERAICYLHALILHRRPAEEHEDWITFFVEQTSQGKEIDIMRTIADMHYEEGIEKGREEGIEQGRQEGREEGHQEGREEGHQEGREEGREEGERKGTIESILALLGARFHPDAVQALKPTIETIDDLSRLKELLLAVPYAQSVEAFTKTLYE